MWHLEERLRKERRKETKAVYMSYNLSLLAVRTPSGKLDGLTFERQAVGRKRRLMPDGRSREDESKGVDRILLKE